MSGSPGENPIFAVAARASTMRAHGIDVISLAAGEPETPTSPSVVNAAREAATNGRHHHYGPAAGLPELRRTIAEQRIDRGIPTDENHVQVTVGAKHALFAALSSLISTGDEVLVPVPGWPGHHEVVAAAGGTTVPVATAPDRGFLLGPEDLDPLISSRTKALVLANPANPTGALHDPELLRRIVSWCAEHRIHLIADEVYAELTYDSPHTPAAAVATPTQREWVVTIDAVSKAHAMTGWRVGWLVAEPQIAARARLHVAATITHVPGIMQEAALVALSDTATPAAARRVYRARRNRLVHALNDIDGFTCDTPAGGMFAFPQVTATSGGAHAGGATAGTIMASRLLTAAHVATIPGEAFRAPDHLRLCFAVDDTTLDRAIERISNELAHRRPPKTLVLPRPAGEGT